METASLIAFAFSNPMESSSVTELKVNYYMIQIIAIFGIWPIASMTLLLHTMAQRSAYHLTLSTTSAVMSTFITSLVSSTNVDTANIKPSVMVLECGSGNQEQFCNTLERQAYD